MSSSISCCMHAWRRINALEIWRHTYIHTYMRCRRRTALHSAISAGGHARHAGPYVTCRRCLVAVTDSMHTEYRNYRKKCVGPISADILCGRQLKIGTLVTRAVQGNVHTNFGFLYLFVSELGPPTRQTDGQTDGRAWSVMRLIRTGALKRLLSMQRLFWQWTGGGLWRHVGNAGGRADMYSYPSLPW